MIEFSSLFLAFLFSSCSIIGQTNSRECYNQLKIFVKDRWEYNKEGNYYEEGKGLIGLTGTYRQCVETMSKKQIMKIFGKPSEIDTEKEMLIYYEMSDCNKNSEFCTKLYFMFQDNKVKKFRFTIATSSSH